MERTICGVKVPTKEKLWFKHWAPQKFTQGRWISHGEDYVSVWYLVYKTVLTCYLLGFYVYNHIYYRQKWGNEDWWKYWIYLTHWGYEVFIWHRILDFGMVVARFASENYYKDEFQKPRENSNSVEEGGGDNPAFRKPFLHETNHFWNQLLWFMTTTSYTLALNITVAYWTLLYSPTHPRTTLENFVNVNEHLIQGLVALLDTFVSASPRRLVHVWAPMVLSGAYVTFNAIYITTGGTNEYGEDYIYSILKWNESPGKSVLFVLGAVVGGLLTHLVFWALAKGRDKIWTKTGHFKTDESGHRDEKTLHLEMTSSNRSNKQGPLSMIYNG